MVYGFKTSESVSRTPSATRSHANARSRIRRWIMPASRGRAEIILPRDGARTAIRQVQHRMRDECGKAVITAVSGSVNALSRKALRQCGLPPGGGKSPTCIRNARLSHPVHVSAILPSSIRWTMKLTIRTRFPVAGMSPNAPSWVPVPVVM